jgi:hypothetical protein
MEWYNDAHLLTISHIGRLPMENGPDFTPGQRTAVAWSGNEIKVRIPWTMLYFYDPTQMKVIDGAISHDGGISFEILPTQSDGIGISVYYGKEVISTMSRYIWNKWLVTPNTALREKKSYQVVKTELPSFAGFAD